MRDPDYAGGALTPIAKPVRFSTIVWEYPATKAYRPLHQVSKTRKLDDGRFEGIAALYFLGVRQNMKTFIAETRARALRGAERLIEGKTTR